MKGSNSSNSSKSLNGKPVLEALRAIVIGTVAGAILCAVLLGVCSLVFVSSENIPQNVLAPFVIALSVVSAFFAGFISAKISRKRGLFYGLLSGIFLFALFLAAGLIAEHEAVSAASGTRLLVMALAGSIGGLVAVNKKAKIK